MRVWCVEGKEQPADPTVAGGNSVTFFETRGQAQDFIKETRWFRNDRGEGEDPVEKPYVVNTTRAGIVAMLNHFAGF